KRYEGGGKQGQHERKPGPDDSQPSDFMAVMPAEQVLCLGPTREHQQHEPEIVEKSEDDVISIGRARQPLRSHCRGKSRGRLHEHCWTENDTRKNLAYHAGLAQTRKEKAAEMRRSEEREQ